MIVRKAANMTRQINKPILGVVENMSYAVCPHCGARYDLFGTGHAATLADEFGVPFLGALGLEQGLAQACDAGQIETYQSAEFDAILETISQRLAALQ